MCCVLVSYHQVQLIWGCWILRICLFISLFRLGDYFLAMTSINNPVVPSSLLFPSETYQSVYCFCYAPTATGVFLPRTHPHLLDNSWFALRVNDISPVWLGLLLKLYWVFLVNHWIFQLWDFLDSICFISIDWTRFFLVLVLRSHYSLTCALMQFTDHIWTFWIFLGQLADLYLFKLSHWKLLFLSLMVSHFLDSSCFLKFCLADLPLRDTSFSCMVY